jgi:ATP-dependent RNA helicase RhlE
MSFESFGLEAELLRAVREQGYDEPTPIQAQAIPAVLQGRDLMGGAQTGTGKTAGFTLPMLNLLHNRPAPEGSRAVRALILTPTRELAAQVGESVRTYGKYLGISSTVIFGGVNIRPQKSKLRSGVGVVVATPGRLLDHARQGTVDLSKVEILVLDEADRMLDMGFIHDIRKIIAMLPARQNRQNLMFSATFSRDIKKLANQLLTNPRLIEVAGTNATADTVEQVVHTVDRRRKRELLSHMIGKNNWRQVLVFSRTKHGANRLAQQLDRDGLEAAAIHGNKSQAARTRALKQFKSGEIRVLVATDIAARGLDISQLPHVINFELPNVPEDYVHRIGRTGRAGHEGQAISLVSAEEHKQLRDIERLLGRELPKEVLAGYETRPESRVSSQSESDDRPRPGNGRPGRNTRRRQSSGERGRQQNGRRRSQGRANGAAPRTTRVNSSQTSQRRQPGTQTLAEKLFGAEN